MTTDNTPATLATVKHGGCVQLGDSLTRFRCAGYDPTDGSGPIMVADREGPWVLAADVLSTSRNGNAAPEEAETSASKDDWFGDVLGSIGTVIPLGAALSAQPQYITDAYELGMRDGQNLSAQPSPGGQGDALVDTARRNIRQFISKASFSSAVDKQAALSCVDVLEEAIAARQPVGEPVAKSVGIDALVQLLVDDAEECAKGWVERGDAYASGKSAGLLAAADYFRKIATSQRWSEFLSAPAQAVDLGPVRAALQAAEALCVCCASVDGYSRSELNAFGQNMRSQFTEALALIDSKAVGNG